MTENEIGKIIVHEALETHRELGPGLLETVYEIVFAKRLSDAGLSVDRQAPIPIVFRGEKLDGGFRADILVNDCVIVELKSVENLNAAHKKQLLTYLRLSGKKLGFLLNFGASLMKDGIVRTVNGL